MMEAKDIQVGMSAFITAHFTRDWIPPSSWPYAKNRPRKTLLWPRLEVPRRFDLNLPSIEFQVIRLPVISNSGGKAQRGSDNIFSKTASRRVPNKVGGRPLPEAKKIDRYGLIFIRETLGTGLTNRWSVRIAALFFVRHRGSIIYSSCRYDTLISTEKHPNFGGKMTPPDLSRADRLE
jgi:hypothetical protein